jgi:hypothetical protein
MEITSADERFGFLPVFEVVRMDLLVNWRWQSGSTYHSVEESSQKPVSQRRNGLWRSPLPDAIKCLHIQIEFILIHQEVPPNP